MSEHLGVIVLDMMDAGAVHLRCTFCHEAERIDPDIPEDEQHPAGVLLATLLTWAATHRCPVDEMVPQT